MTEEEIMKRLDELEKLLAQATARAEKAEAELIVAKLSAEDREAYQALPEEKRATFVQADDQARVALLAEGRELVAKQNIMPDDVAKRFADIQKRLEEAETRAAAAEAIAKHANDERRMVELSKRAEDEFAGLPGTPMEKAVVLKALEDKLTEEEQKAVMTLLNAGNACLLAGVKPIGKSTPVDTGDAWEQIEKRANVIASEKKINPALAMQEFLLTEEGSKLYSAYLDAKRH